MKTPRRPGRRPRSDGDTTRLRIIEVAGRLCAEQGFAATASSAICRAAGTDLAAVNYHFGGRAGLYEAVLAAAHGQLVALDDLEAIHTAATPPQRQLRQIVGLLMDQAADPDRPWGMRLLLREFTSPSRHLPALLRGTVLPKIRIMMDVVARLLDASPQERRVQQALAFVVFPCVMMSIAPRGPLRRVLPGLDAPASELADALTAYALAGLRALRRR